MSKKAGMRSKYALLEHKSKRVCELESTVVIGRENADIVFPGQDSLSRQHFRITIDQDGAWIEDLGSSNGTKLNKAKLPPNTRQALFHGDSITAGKASFAFQIRGTPKDEPESESPPVKAGKAAPEIKPRGPVSNEDKLSPEISLVLDQPMRGKPSRVRPEIGVVSMLHHHSDDALSGKSSGEGPSGLTHQWTTLLLLFGLSYVAFVEYTEIQASPTGGTHTVRELILRYLFAVGLMYLITVVLQFIFVMTFARRWYLAVFSMGLSVFIGSQIGEKLDDFAEYHKAEVENHLQVSKLRAAKKTLRSASRSIATQDK